MNKPSFLTLARWLCAGAVGSWGLFLLARVMNTEAEWMAVFGKSLLGIGGLLAGAVLISPEVVGWAVIPLYGLVDRVLLPSESEPPPADYHLARFYHRHGRSEEAREEYLKIVRYHPEQTAAYLEGIASAMLAGDEGTVEKLYRRGRRALRSADDRQLLAGVYESRRELAQLDEEAMEPAEEPEGNGSEEQTGAA